MNIRFRSVYLLAFVLAAACGREGVVGPTRTVMVTRSWPAADIRQIKVFEVSGNIRVEAAPTTEVSLEAKVHGRIHPKQDAENQGLFRSEIEGDTLRISRIEGK